MVFENLTSNLGLVNLMALMAVIVIGLPHGAFDGSIAVQLGFMKRPYSLIRFLFLYLLIAAFVIFLWLIFPAASLIFFLLISVLHFGFSDAKAESGWFRWVQVFAHGGVVVIGISQFHKMEVNKIFSYLSWHDSDVVWSVIDISSLIMFIVILIYAYYAFCDKRWRKGFFELNLLLIIFFFFSPLVGFALYFCCFHSMRHFLFLWRSLQKTLQIKYIYFQAVSFTVSSWLMAGFAYWYFSDQMSGEVALVRVTFIGLAALTVPHMILVDVFYRRRMEML